MGDKDKSTLCRARSLYPYDGRGPGCLSFAENLILTVHPSMSGGDWWWQTIKFGFLPKILYRRFPDKSKAKALYAYNSGISDERPFDQGDELTITYKSDAGWWKTERNGVVFVVPSVIWKRFRVLLCSVFMYTPSNNHGIRYTTPRNT